MGKMKRVLPFLLAGLFLLTAAGALYVKAEEIGGSELIAEGVYIGSIAVGGMTQEEASEAVTAHAEQLNAVEFTLAAGEKSVTVTGEQLGLYWSNEEVCQEAYEIGKSGNLISRYKDIKDLEQETKVLPLKFSVNPTQVQQILGERETALTVEAKDFGLVRENGGFVITEGCQGVGIDMESSVAGIIEYFETEWNEEPATVELVTIVTEPKGSREELLMVKDVLGSYSTDYSTSPWGRAQNVTNGTSKINGSLLYPGESFSVYEAVNPFTAENGYELAGSYENGTTVQSYGGGICQVSTTLYNAVLGAELQVDERYAHSMIVSYVQPSMDAAIAGTYKDLKFTNNKEYPIYIEGYTYGGRVYFNIYGAETRDSSRKVTYESETTEVTEPEIKIEQAADKPIGYIERLQSSHTGYKAKLWKIVTINGVQQSKDVINNSNYKASPSIYSVGVKSDNKEAVKAIKQAIKEAMEKDDISIVEAAIAKWNDKALKEQEEKENQQSGGNVENSGDSSEDEEPVEEDSEDEGEDE